MSTAAVDDWDLRRRVRTIALVQEEVGDDIELEPALVVLADDSWEKVLNRYLMLGEFIDVVADIIREYHERGHFTARLSFPA